MFAVHPLQVEAVAWASCQPYLLCALFCLLAVLAYLHAFGPGPPRWGWWAGSLLLFAAALLSKAPAVALPAILVLLDVYPLRRLGGRPGGWFGPEARRAWLDKVPFVAIGLVFAGLAVAARATVYAIAPLEREGVAPRVARACYAAWFYIVKAVIPTDLAAYYAPPARVDWGSPPMLASLLATLAVCAGLILLRRRWPGLLAAWLGYLALLAPASGLVQIGSLFVADRYSYLPMMALAVPIAAGLAGPWAAPRRGRAAALATAGALAVVAGLVLLTREQCRTWRSSEVLWSRASNTGAASAMAHLKLGAVSSSLGRLAEAEAHLREAARLQPDGPLIHRNLGTVLERRGNYADALAHYAEAVRFDRDRVNALNNLAMVLAACPDPGLRDGRRAVATATRVCELLKWNEPNSLDTLAAAHAEAGDFAAAIARQEQAIDLLPDGPGKDDYRSRLALYRAREACSVSPPPRPHPPERTADRGLPAATTRRTISRQGAKTAGKTSGSGGPTGTMPGGVISSSLRPFASVLPNLAVLDGDLDGSA